MAGLPPAPNEFIFMCTVVVELACPHCDHSFLEAVSLTKPQESVYCPVCEHVFLLDPEVAAMSNMLERAHAAGRERQRRRKSAEQLRQQASPATPATSLTDILRKLDALMLELESRDRGERRRA